MALVFLLFVLFAVVIMIVAFVFPPTKWLEWFYGSEKKKD